MLEHKMIKLILIETILVNRLQSMPAAKTLVILLIVINKIFTQFQRNVIDLMKIKLFFV